MHKEIYYFYIIFFTYSIDKVLSKLNKLIVYIVYVYSTYLRTIIIIFIYLVDLIFPQYAVVNAVYEQLRTKVWQIL